MACSQMFRRLSDGDHGFSEAEELGELNLAVDEAYLDQRSTPSCLTTNQKFVFATANFRDVSSQLGQLKLFI